MKKVFAGLEIALAFVCLSWSALAATVPNFVITNDNVRGPNTATLYEAAGTVEAPTLSFYQTLSTGGTGIGGGFYAQPSVIIILVGNKECAFVSDAGSNDIAGILLTFHPQVTGRFKGSKTDSGKLGIGLAAKGQKLLYAAFTGSRTIATFSIQPGCTLSFQGDVSAVGLNGGAVNGMKVNKNSQVMVVAYGDGSIESFNLSTGAPLSNQDLQDSTGYGLFYGLPSGVDITSDGHYAIFGDTGAWIVVEVSDLSKGKLATTVAYGGPHGIFGDYVSASDVYLSPDETLIYIGSNFSGLLEAAEFNAAKGKITTGCISAPFTGFGDAFSYTAGLTLGSNTGTGTPVYINEAPGAIDSPPSYIGIVNVTSSGGACTLEESAASPVSDPASAALLSSTSYPPRAF